MPSQDFIQATGRRKAAIARVRLFTKGEGNVEVNERTMESYFPRDVLKMQGIVTGKQIGRASCRERVYVLV